MIENADLQAAADVAQQLFNEADSLDADTAIERLMALRALIVQCKAAESELQTRALRQLEQPRIVGDRVWRKVKRYTSRYRQDTIAGRVVTLAAVDPSTGETLSAMEATERAVKMMRALYVAPSTKPKSGGLNAVGVAFGDVTVEEFKEWQLDDIRLSEPDEERE